MPLHREEIVLKTLAPILSNHIQTRITCSYQITDINKKKHESCLQSYSVVTSPISAICVDFLGMLFGRPSGYFLLRVRASLPIISVHIVAMWNSVARSLLGLLPIVR